MASTIESTLTDEEKELFKSINSLRIADVESSLKSSKVKIDCVDENGMTPLETAAYKGDYDIAKLLIDRGADVNSDKHQHGYTALMFAALGGHLRVVNLLLEAGANVEMRNSVGRNAAQMAAFVGQHGAVTLINSYVPKAEIEYYTKPQGLEKTPKLPANLAEPLHVFCRQSNIHPVKIVFQLQQNKLLMENAKTIAKVLHLMCEREMKKEEPNEILCLKFHFLGFIIDFVLKQISNVKKEDKDTSKVLEVVVKSWLKGRDEDAFPITLEQLLRQSIREFPFRDCSLFLQLVKTLSSTPIGEEPSAISILLKTVNGQKGFDEESPVCSTCGEPNPSKTCSQCKKIQYCNQECQKLHWFSHKKVCLKLKEMARIEAEQEEAAAKVIAEQASEKAS